MKQFCDLWSAKLGAPAYQCEVFYTKCQIKCQTNTKHVKCSNREVQQIITMTTKQQMAKTSIFISLRIMTACFQNPEALNMNLILETFLLQPLKQ